MTGKAEARWEMLNVAMSHYQNHIKEKEDHCSLSIVDLLHVSNFKGGNASITEPVKDLPGKLKKYEQALKDIEQSFRGKSLASLEELDKESLKSHCEKFLSLATASESKIRGFGPSYASALLAAHFIDLIPVLDRRALNGAGISVEKDGQGQVKDISSHYGKLIDAFSKKLKKTPKLTLRELDKKWFSKDL